MNSEHCSKTTIKPVYTSSYSKEAWEVKVSLPGVDKQDLSLSIESEVLEIKASRNSDHPEDWKRLSGTDQEVSYQLKLDVGPEVDDGKIEASLENGELLVRLPLKEEVKPRQIPIS